MSLPWYAHKLKDYDERTDHLTMRQHGCYRMLMDSYYRRGGPLPKEVKQLASICKAFASGELADLSLILSEFFILLEDGWHNVGCDKEISKAKEISEKRRKAGKTGGDAKAIAVANATQIASLASAKQLPPHSTLPQEVSKKDSLNGFAFGRNGKTNGHHEPGTTTIKSPEQRLAKFQQTLAKHLKDNQIVQDSMNLDAPNHAIALATCRTAATELGKGWPYDYPQVRAGDPQKARDMLKAVVKRYEEQARAGPRI